MAGPGRTLHEQVIELGGKPAVFMLKSGRNVIIDSVQQLDTGMIPYDVAYERLTREEARAKGFTQDHITVYVEL